MEIIKVKDSDELGKKAAEIVAAKIKEQNESILGLATGSTPEKMYANLIEDYNAGDLSFSNTTTFNLDEYAGLASDHPNSYRYYMDHNLFNHIDIEKQKTYIPNGTANDLEAECTHFEELIKQTGTIDLQLIGLGLNGHIGFNEPGTSFDERTHVVRLKQSTRAVNARFFPSLNDVPKLALTMGIATILEAKQILFLVQGEHKADILKKVVHGDVTEDVPASVLQTHPNVILLTDIDI